MNKGGAVPTGTSIESDGSRQLSLTEAEAWEAAACEGATIESALLPPARAGTGIAIGRTLKLLDGKSNVLLECNEPVWPVWVPESDSESALAKFEENWADAADQARSTAKWLAAILGTALAALVGSAPLSGIRGEYIPWLAYVMGAAGVACISFTLFLVVRVLVPEVTDFDDLISGKRPFDSLRDRFERDTGTLLPLRVRTFAELSGRMRLEAITLDQLEKRINECRGDASREQEFKAYCDAQVGRSKWLSYLTKTATQWTVIASYQAVKYQAGWARTAGLISGTVGTILILVAFLMPRPQASAVNLASYRLAHSTATAAAQAIIGEGCTAFRGVVTSVESNGDLTVPVQPTDVCNSASIAVPGKNLIQIPSLTLN